MTEQSLNKKLKKWITVCSVIGIVILFIGAVALNILQSSLNNVISDQIEDETAEYTRRIRRQVEKDFQTLEAMAKIFAYGNMTDQSWFEECFQEVNLASSFPAISYFGDDGIGDIVYKDYGIKQDIDYHILDEKVQKSIESAYRGIRNVSEMFESYVEPEKIFTYSVPVRGRDGKITGVLSAGSTVNTFDDIVSSDLNPEGVHAVYLVNTKGQLLLSSESKRKQDIPKNIFHASYFPEKMQRDIDEALENGDPLLTKMNREEEDYYVYLDPVGINSWYIMYVSSQKGVNEIVYSMVNAIGIIFILLLTVIVSLLIYTCRMMINHNKSLVEIAYKDGLTGVENLAMFNQRLDAAKREYPEFSLVALNIHKFKFVNEIFGTAAGDNLLKNIAEVIEKGLEKDEFFCRESGDLFYIFLKQTETVVIQERMSSIIRKICKIRISEQADYQIMLYTGVLIWKREDGMEIPSNEMLITKTRFAMQSSKKLPANHIHFYDKAIHKNEEMKNYVESHMHQALQKGEFRLYLQPKVYLRDRKLGGAEALVRWITEEGAIIFPNDFIPQFERNGFCVQLDMYMVEQACRQIREWMDNGIDPIPISVNQSKLLFFDAGYIDNLQKLLDRYQVPAKLITLEILESLALEHARMVNEKLRILRRIGFKVSMDDFGSGYSSFNTLGNLEIDELKLDRSFLMEAAETEENRFGVIMEHIINLTKSLNITTVAEGVETSDNEKLISELGCDYGQGYLYSPPISAREFSEKYMFRRSRN